MSQAIVKLADDEFIEWGSIVDAPVSYIHTKEEAISKWGDERVQRADSQGTSFTDNTSSGPEYVRFNRCGPRSTPYTLAAMRQRFRSHATDADFVFTPEAIEPYTTADLLPDNTFGPVRWEPWAPGEIPENWREILGISEEEVQLG